MNQAVLLLGSNVGARPANLERAIMELGEHAGQINMQSPVYETAPWGNTHQAPFLNQVVVLSTTMHAAGLMDRILSIEERMGRRRKEKWEPRVIDIDILFFNDEIRDEKNLTIPHPEMHKRKFTLVPLAQLLPGFVHPVLKKTVSELLGELDDPLEVKKISPQLS